MIRCLFGFVYVYCFGIVYQASKEKETLKTRWWVSFLQYYLIYVNLFCCCFSPVWVSNTAMPTFLWRFLVPLKLCGSHLNASHGKQHMDGEGGGVLLADLGRMSLLKMPTDLESLGTKDFHYPTHQLTLFRAPHVGYQRPHHWLSSGLHASLTTFGAGDRQGKAQWMWMPGTWKIFVNPTYPTYLVMFWGVGSKNKMTMLSVYC